MNRIIPMYQNLVLTPQQAQSPRHWCWNPIHSGKSIPRSRTLVYHIRGLQTAGELLCRYCVHVKCLPFSSVGVLCSRVSFLFIKFTRRLPGKPLIKCQNKASAVNQESAQVCNSNFYKSQSHANASSPRSQGLDQSPVVACISHPAGHLRPNKRRRASGSRSYRRLGVYECDDILFCSCGGREGVHITVEYYMTLFHESIKLQELS